MKYEVILRLHEDDATGKRGLCHANAVGKFNAFWSPDGIFHDVFEHYFEDKHKYFSGNAAFTIWGEMCASGHGIAYAQMGIDNFRYRNSPKGRDFTVDTTTQFEDWVHGHSDYLDFPIENCLVPRQETLITPDLNFWLNLYRDWLAEHSEINPEKVKLINEKSVVNTYTLGYKTAMRIIGKDWDHSYTVLDNFLTKWYDITKDDAEHLGIADENAYPIRGFKFVVNTLPKLSVKCTILDESNNEYPLDLLTSF